jgi:hypothetical protein
LVVKHDQERKAVEESSTRVIEKDKVFRNITIPRYDDEEFVRHFRMKRSTFHVLLEQLSPYLPKPFNGMGSVVIPPEERLYIYIWYMATSETYRALACRFGTTDSVVHESVDMVLNAIMKVLTSEVMFPSTLHKCKKIAAKFAVRNGFPNIIGAIDGTHIRITKPRHEPDVWIDRKGSYSISCAAIVDSDLRFLHYVVGCPGSMHDQRVYRLSEIDDLLAAVPDSMHLIGDSAYALTTKLLVPYKDTGSLTARQRQFNYMLSSNRMAVENAFGLLKNKFARIQGTLNTTSWKRAVIIIRSAILLHNFILNEELMNETVDTRQMPMDLPRDPKDKRDRIAALFDAG